MELDFWMNKIQDSNELEHKVKEICFAMYFIVSVISFDRKVCKHWVKGKKKKQNEIKSLNLSESNEHCKTNAGNSFET